MNTYIGIDLGTSGVKLLLVTGDGRILSECTRHYPCLHPKEGWSEQDAQMWYVETLAGLAQLLEGQDRSLVRGIAAAGQMHGLVTLDKEGNLIRPAILWNDGRAQAQTEYLNGIVGKSELSRLTGNVAFAGFTAPKLMWMREHERKNFARISRIMLPKDYLVYRLCGEFSTDCSDAGGTLLFDVKNRAWSQEMCGVCGISEHMLPKVYESFSPIGTLKNTIAEELGLPRGVTVAAGAGDNAAAAVGMGAVGEGECNISVGTSGTIFISSDKFVPCTNNSLHSFCHADGGWHLLACILSAAASHLWWMKDVLRTSDFAEEEQDLYKRLGKSEVFFLPYLMGERCPHNDPSARAAFIGMSATTSREDMTLAVLEGVAFALNECLTLAKDSGISVPRATLCGGGAKSRVWRKIISSVLDIPLSVPRTEHGPALGAAMLAMTACGEYPSVRAASRALSSAGRENTSFITPDGALAEHYAARYQKYRAIYPALKSIF